MTSPRGRGAVASPSRVVVAMSGGVDSSVVAALLAEAGHEVVGVTLQLYDHGAALRQKGACCAGQDIHDARRVADRLGIPHYVLDFEARFREAVIDDFAATYARGQTPIPCVRCNQRIKFRDLLQIARDLDAEALATGHYVRRVERAGGLELHIAEDAGRDQSYFLFATTRDQLDFLRFPLGDLPKRETRALAARFDLEVAGKPDSQDICFVPQGHYTGVVERLRPEAFEPGELVDEAGRVLGRHAGIGHYTVGQRRGLQVAAGERLYVRAIEPAARRVVVGPKRATLVAAAELSDPNWLAEPRPGQRVMVKCRANDRPAPAWVETTSTAVRVTFEAPQSGVAPGQACVAYAGTRVLGGGWIARTIPLSEAELEPVLAAAGGS